MIESESKSEYKGSPLALPPFSASPGTILKVRCCPLSFIKYSDMPGYRMRHIHALPPIDYDQARHIIVLTYSDDYIVYNRWFKISSYPEVPYSMG